MLFILSIQPTNWAAVAAAFEAQPYATAPGAIRCFYSRVGST